MARPRRDTHTPAVATSTIDIDRRCHGDVTGLPTAVDGDERPQQHHLGEEARPLVGREQLRRVLLYTSATRATVTLRNHRDSEQLGAAIPYVPRSH